MSTVEKAVIALLDCTRDGQVQPSGAAVGSKATWATAALTGAGRTVFAALPAFGWMHGDSVRFAGRSNRAPPGAPFVLAPGAPLGVSAKRAPNGNPSGHAVRCPACASVTATHLTGKIIPGRLPIGILSPRGKATHGVAGPALAGRRHLSTVIVGACGWLGSRVCAGARGWPRSRTATAISAGWAGSGCGSAVSALGRRLRG